MGVTGGTGSTQSQYWEYWGKYWSTRIWYWELVFAGTGGMGWVGTRQCTMGVIVGNTGLYWEVLGSVLGGPGLYWVQYWDTADW